MMQTQVNRYSQEELEEFRLLIEKKIAKSQEQVDSMQSQIDEINADGDDHGMDAMEDSSNSSQL